MGNQQSAEGGDDGGRRQKQSDQTPRLYRFVDMHGGGELIPWMRYAKVTGDTSIIDEFIETKLREFMYNSGKGKMEAVAELVKIRNKERNAMLSALKRKKGKGKSGPNILDEFQQEGHGDLQKALKLLEGGGKGGKEESKYREVVWKVDERGTMGENLVGVCLLQGTAVHNQLAVKLIDAYPKLVNDIFISEDYYGLSPLHLAIINEDPTMVHFLLRHGADTKQRCYGASFCPDDQKGSRTDSLEHEFVDLCLKTSYDGMYFGELPLSFAACINQADCYRLLIAKGADPNFKDTNGNTALHLAIIHEQSRMLKLCYDTGAKLQVMNNQGLTPLTLAAHLAKKEMFERILRLEANVMWMYGCASSHAYPLAKIDTINQETGGLNADSALALIVYGLIDGLLEELLQAKWEAFGRRRLTISFLSYLFYYFFVFTAYMCRPFSMTTQVITDEYIDGTDTTLVCNATRPFPCISKYSTMFDHLAETYLTGNFTIFKKYGRSVYAEDSCHMVWYFNRDVQQLVRLVAEIAVLLMTIFQISTDIIDIRSIGKKRWWQVLKSFPAKIAYKISFFFIIMSIPARFACNLGSNLLLIDNALALMSVLLSSVHFLFYSRAVKFLGPFVLMIYTILSRDLSRFFVIYAIFLIGFSQGNPFHRITRNTSKLSLSQLTFYLIFLSCTRTNTEKASSYNNVTNIIDSPFEATMRLFIMTIGEFMTFYRTLSSWCKQPVMRNIGKMLFIIYELFVSVMQFNLLIAMMTRTYDAISGTQTEWKRQWAQVILMLELSLTPRERLTALLKYSRPIGTDKRKRAFVVARKTTTDCMTKTEKQLREQEACNIREEKRALLKRRMKDGSVLNRIDQQGPIVPTIYY